MEVVKADAYDVAQTCTLTEGATAVYQCAQPEYPEWEEPFVMDDSKFRRAFGTSPTPMRQAIQETADWFRGRS